MKIALFLPNISYPLGKSLFDGVRSAALETGDKVICFLGTYITKNGSYPMYHLALRPDIDGIISYGGGMGQFVGEEDLKKFLDNFSSKPLLNVGFRVSGINNLDVNNYEGMKEIVLHLIETHGHRKIAFVSGPEFHPENTDRFKAYKDALREHDIPYDDALIVHGDFRPESGTATAKPLSELFLKKKITAVAYACDTMASASIAELTRRGISFPHDLAAVGFDNSDESISRLPGLSTVDQSAHTIGKTALFKMREIIKGNLKNQNTVLPVRTVLRESCGCISDMIKNVSQPPGRPDLSRLPLHPRLLEKIDSESIGEMETLMDSDIKGDSDYAFLEYLSTYKPVMEFFNESGSNGFSMRRFQDYLSEYQLYMISRFPQDQQKGFSKIMHQMRVFIQMQSENALVSRRVQGDHLMRTLNLISNQFIAASNFEEIKSLLNKHMAHYKIEALGISLEENNEEYSVEYLYTKSGLSFEIPLHYKKTVLVPPLLDASWREGNLITHPLFSHNHYWGFIFFLFNERITVNDGVFIESLSSQIASALNQIRLIQERNQAEERLRNAYSGLEKMNKKLENLSFRDGLTGLYNRRGFMEISENKIRECKMKGQDFLVLYGDLDGLKIINDQYGHEEGDYAISSIASIIRSVCRDSDIVARLGGDEFVALIPGVPKNYKTILSGRLKQSELNLNQSDKKEFDVSCSFGMVLSTEFPEENLSFLMAKADKRLYINKRDKRKY